MLKFVTLVVALFATTAAATVTRAAVSCPDEVPVRRLVSCELHLRNSLAQPEADGLSNWSFTVTQMPGSTAVTRVTPLVADDLGRVGVFQFTFWTMEVAVFDVVALGPASLSTNFQVVAHDRVISCFDSAAGVRMMRQMRWTDASSQNDKVPLSGPPGTYFVDTADRYTKQRFALMQQSGVVGRVVPQPVDLASWVLQDIAQSAHQTCESLGRTDSTNSGV